MTTTISLRHVTEYTYDRPVELGPQLVRLRPAPHARTPIPHYGLRIEPKEHFCNWQQDPHGNYVARLVFPKPTTHFRVEVELSAELVVQNPFDFFLEPSAENCPFEYDAALTVALAPYLIAHAEGPLFDELVESIPRESTQTVSFLVDLNQRLERRVRYVTRLEPGVQTPEETLTLGSGSCRDSAFLMVQLMRRIGLAARFVSGYLVQLVADRASTTGPAGPTSDFTDLHAWAEVYLPGAGWVGLDPTSGLFAGEGHIPLAATPEPEDAAPVTGSFAYETDEDDTSTARPADAKPKEADAKPEEAEDTVNVTFGFEMELARVHETPPIERTFSASEWQAIDTLGETIDRSISAAGLVLTMGGEPTFVAEADPDGEEWNLSALGPTKRAHAQELAERLISSFAPGAMMHVGEGKWYPGESLPRWAITLGWRRDGVALWNDPGLFADENAPRGHVVADAARFVNELASRLGAPSAHVHPAFEDPFYYAWREQRLPKNVDPLASKLADKEERARVAHVFEKGLTSIVGYVLPIVAENGVFRSGRWDLRDDKLLLTPGDSAMGLRLPLESLPWEAPEDRSVMPPHDPMAAVPPLPSATSVRETIAAHHARGARRSPATGATGASSADEPAGSVVRTALCVEPRKGMLHVFLPPIGTLDDFVVLLGAVEQTSATLGLPVRLEGYLPPSDPRWNSLQVTPDPGVIEVNVHPAGSWAELSNITKTVYAEAAACRLTAEKFLLDGRHVGTGGGHHIVLGGPTASESPFVLRPDLLASFTAYFQCHPALSYLFSGMFIGPTSQHPRIDEARTETRWELETAIGLVPESGHIPPWVTDRLFRNVLVDMTGNTHRTEICIDKLYSPDASSGRRGLVEFRAFEMAPQPGMSLVMQLVMRALFARFADDPFRGPLAAWGPELHDRFLLPHFVWADFLDILDDLREHGFDFDSRWFERQFEYRFPRYGRVTEREVTMELRMALEPWHVLGEEPGTAGTVRHVDSSVERVQVKLEGATPGRHVVLCNGRPVPLGAGPSMVGGVRFRAWQPPSCLHPTIPVQAPLVFELVDLHRGRAVSACTYHVSHPGGRHHDGRPHNAREAESRRDARFEPDGSSGLAAAAIARLGHERPRSPFIHTLDLIRG